MIPLFSQKEDTTYARFFLLKKNEIMLLTYEKKMEEELYCLTRHELDVELANVIIFFSPPTFAT